jgi:hypothetical protein
MKVCGLLSYKCLKCSEPVKLEIRLGMTETTLDLWRDMFDAKLCLNCHCNKQVPKLAECLVN